MIDLSWTIEDDHDADLTGAPRPLLSTWHYLRNALRRRWRTWVGLTMLGAMLGVGAVALMPPGSTGTVTLLMAHPANIDGPEGIAMDVSLLSTREVAQRTVQRLGLSMSPEEFQSLVSDQPVTSQILSISVTGPDDATAVARSEVLVSEYLAFRTAQLQSLNAGLVSGYQTRIAGMQQQVKDLNTRYSQLTAKGGALESQAFEVLARRTELNSEIASMQQAIADATLQTDAAVQSTHVIDPPRADRSSTKRAMALAGGSGLIAGAALGIGFVLFRALISDRLRRRQDVSIALGSPVRFSVRSMGPSRERAGWSKVWPLARGRLDERDLKTLVRGFESAVRPITDESFFSAVSRPSLAGAAASDPTAPALVSVAARSQPGDPCDEGGAGSTNGQSTADHLAPSAGQAGRRGVALAAIGNAGSGADIIDAVACRFRDQGMAVFLVDLSTSAALARRRSRSGSGGGPMPAVFRPDSSPELARGPLGATSHTVIDLPAGAWREAWEAADVVLALVEVDPGVEAENLASWVSRVVPLVTAGQSTAELLGTTGELIRAAGLVLPFVMMMGCDSSDESLGLGISQADAVWQASPS